MPCIPGCKARSSSTSHCQCRAGSSQTRRSPPVPDRPGRATQTRVRRGLKEAETARLRIAAPRFQAVFDGIGSGYERAVRPHKTAGGRGLNLGLRLNEERAHVPLEGRRSSTGLPGTSSRRSATATAVAALAAATRPAPCSQFASHERRSVKAKPRSRLPAGGCYQRVREVRRPLPITPSIRCDASARVRMPRARRV